MYVLKRLLLQPSIKKYFTIGDQYVVMVYDDRCQDIVVAILLAIDYILDRRKGSGESSSSS